MVAHLFGTTSSPSCASFVLRKCAEDNQEQFSQKVVETVLHSFYIDDCLVSVCSEEKAVLLYRELRTLPAAAAQEWTIWLEELCNLEDFKVSRCLKHPNFGVVVSAQIHHFADVSEDDYGTVTYLLLHCNISLDRHNVHS